MFANIVLRISRLGEVTEVSLSQFQTVAPDSDSVITVVDKETGEVPGDLVLNRKGANLEIEIDGDAVAEVSDFYADGADLAFSLDGSPVPADSMVLSSEAAAEEGIVWEAGAAAETAGASGLLQAAGILGGGAALAFAGIHDDDGSAGRPPAIEMTSGGEGSADENAPASTAIYTAAATHTATYSLRDDLSDDAALLSIDSETGTVTLLASADAESKGTYSFTVVATDGTSTTEQAVTVSVNDLNDNGPVITSSGANDVDENAAASTVIYTAAATDADATASNNTVTYSLRDDLADDAALVSIDAATGAVTLLASADAEAKDTYNFTVVASDGSNVSEQAVTVSVNDLNDNSPVMTSGATGDVDENAAAGTVIYTAAATDADATASNSTVTYSLRSDLADDAALVSIDASTGAVNLLTSADAESKDTYSFTVIASDGVNTSEQAVTVSVNDLNDNDPVITSGATGNVDENTATSTVIYTAAASDADTTAPNNTVTYSLRSDLADDAALVSINATTGAVTLLASADAESKDTYSFTVVATDSASSSEQAVTVSIDDLSDNAPVITSGATGNIDENAATSTVIYTAAATDADATAPNNTVAYSLRNDLADDAALVSIDASTGVVTLLASADAESKDTYSFTVVADDGSNTSEQAVAVSVNDLNDNTPVMTSGATGNVDENAATSTAIYTAGASDADTTAPNSTVTYSLRNDLADDAALVSIDAGTGVVTLLASADAESKGTYSFTVVASDGSNSSEQAVTVAVNDLNDSTPVITSGATGNVDENAAASTVIYAAAATDADATAPNSTVTYSLRNDLADDAALVSIDNATGAVTLLASADAESQATYSFTVVASDGSNTSEQAVTVSVDDLNDNAPVMTSGATGNVDENAPTSTVIYTAAASDADATAPNNTVTYSLRNDLADDAALVSIDNGTGEVTLLASADYETKDTYNFTVVASDGSTTTEQAVTVSVNDVSEFSGDASIVVFDMTTGESSDHSGQTFQSDVDYTIYIRVDSDAKDLSFSAAEQWSGAANLGAGDQIVLVGDDAGGSIQGPGGNVTYAGPPDDGAGPYSQNFVKVWRVTGHSSPNYDAAVMLANGNFWRKTGPSTANRTTSTAQLWTGNAGSYTNISVAFARTVSGTILSTQGLV